MTADLRPTTLPTPEQVRAMDAFEGWRFAEGLRADLSLHAGDVFECHACHLIRIIERRDA